MFKILFISSILMSAGLQAQAVGFVLPKTDHDYKAISFNFGSSLNKGLLSAAQQENQKEQTKYAQEAGVSGLLSAGFLAGAYKTCHIADAFSAREYTKILDITQATVRLLQNSMYGQIQKSVVANAIPLPTAAEELKKLALMGTLKASLALTNNPVPPLELWASVAKMLDASKLLVKETKPELYLTTGVLLGLGIACGYNAYNYAYYAYDPKTYAPLAKNSIAGFHINDQNKSAQQKKKEHKLKAWTYATGALTATAVAAKLDTLYHTMDVQLIDNVAQCAQNLMGALRDNPLLLDALALKFKKGNLNPEFFDKTIGLVEHTRKLLPTGKQALYATTGAAAVFSAYCAYKASQKCFLYQNLQKDSKKS